MESKYTPYRLVPFSHLVLYKLYFCHLNDENLSEFTAYDILASFSVPVSSNLILTALDFLRTKCHEETPLITRQRREGVYYFRMAYGGFSVVEDALRTKRSDIAYFHEHGDAALDEIAGINSLFLTQQEALEHDPWSPLPIDREDPQYLEAVANVEAALDVIRGDNGFAATYPDQREGIIATLEDGLACLKDRCPSRAQVFSLLISPLQWLATNFSKAVIGEAAKKAAQSLVDFLHSLF
jgi:hypothetical protein